MTEWATDAVNLILERLDRLAEALERLAAALEEEAPNGE